MRKPRIFDTDHGSQLTSVECVDLLQNAAVAISMAYEGRLSDNIFVEIYGELKVEEVYLRDYQTVADVEPVAVFCVL